MLVVQLGHLQQKNPKIDVSWIEGKISGVIYCLIGDSFRRALAEEWKKRYYNK
ncbi:MAG: hypothetical protein Q8L34_01850 [Candidatus Woesearchaeota archaeon]|nr:hypothetical protein [Candidatus Woesearchaeota archaeon]